MGIKSRKEPEIAEYTKFDRYVATFKSKEVAQYDYGYDYYIED